MGATAGSAETAAERGPRATIMVVDDSPDMRGLVAEVLEPAGYAVALVPSGAQALRRMADEPPDLVITDLLMPGMTGFTLRALMLRRPELARIPVIVLSAYWQRPSETLDVLDVIRKPINIDRLLESVARALDGASAAR